MARALSHEVLDRLEHQLQTVGAAPIDGAHQGLAVEHIRRLTAKVVGALPAEAELWWSWCTLAAGWVLPDAQYLTLDEALQEYDERCEWATQYGLSPQSPHVTIDDWWHPQWLPVFVIDGGMLYVVDTAGSDGTSAPIRRIDGQSFGGGYFDKVVAPSLGQFITDRLDAIDAGHYIYDADRHVWTESASR